MIWRHVLNDKQHAANLTIDELASETNVSRTTISRFVKKIGLEGYSEFKVFLRLEKDDEIGDVSTQDYNLACDAIINYVEEQKTKNYDDACKLIYNANKIIIYGSGDIQRSVAAQLKRMFMSCQEMIYDIAGSTVDRSYYKMIDEGDVMILISLSGNNENVLDIARKMKILGAKIISITEFKNNQLTAISDEALYISSTNLNFLKDYPDYKITMLYYVLAELFFIRYSIYKKNRLHQEGIDCDM